MSAFFFAAAAHALPDAPRRAQPCHAHRAHTAQVCRLE